MKKIILLFILVAICIACQAQEQVKKFYFAGSNGSMPKDIVHIYTNDVQYIGLDYSILAMDEPLIVDSLRVYLGAGAHGTAHVQAKCLDVSVRAGSHLTVKGETGIFKCDTKGYSDIDTSQLKVQEIKSE